MCRTLRAYNVHMFLVWDPSKAATNLAKHGIDFADAVSVLEDPMAITIEDDVDEEDRQITVGTDALGRVLVVVFTWRGEAVRIISARSATKRERKHYEGQS